MIKRETKQTLDNIRRNRMRFYYLILSIYSITEGLFYTMFRDYIINRSEPYMAVLSSGIVGWAMMLSGIILLLGYILHNNNLQKIGLLVMSIAWGGMFLVALTFALGTGYPDADWIDKLFTLTIILRVSKKGVYY